MTTAFEQTWQQDNNRAVASESTVVLQAKWVQWYIKAFLKGEIGGASQGLWTCAGSSDSVAAGMDASDRWTSTFDSTKIVRANGAVAHSWIVLQSPAGLGDGPWYMLIDYNTSVDSQTNISFSKTAFTGGSITAAPTSTTSWSYAAQQLVNSTITSAYVFGLLSTDGDFHFKLAHVSSGFFSTAVSFFALTETKTGEAHNGWSMVEFNSTNGSWTRANLNTTSSTRVKGRNYNNTAAVSASLTTEVIAGSSFAMSDVGTADATDGSYNDCPIRVQVDTTSHKSRRGRIRDIMWAPELASIGMVEPLTGPPYTSQVVGDTWQPYNASITALL